jgi:hypothetical protein
MKHRSAENATIQHLVEVLRMAGNAGMTSWTLAGHLRTICVATIVSEARHCGYDIKCSYERESDSGRHVYRYRLVENSDAQTAALAEFDAELDRREVTERALIEQEKT